MFEFDSKLCAFFAVLSIVVSVTLAKLFMDAVVILELLFEVEIDEVVPESHGLIGRGGVKIPVGHSITDKDTLEVDVVLVSDNLVSEVGNVNSGVRFS